MTTVTLMPHDHDWTVADLDHLPDDGLRYELFDGTLVVSPAPTPRHQYAIVRLLVTLDAACPPEYAVFSAPLDFQPTDARSFQPDVMVARRDRIGEKNLTEPPELVVEVLSPSTRSQDQLLKKAMYESSWVPSYWLYDPDTHDFVAYELIKGQYREVVRTRDEVTLERPFPVTIRPDRLADL